MQSGPLLPAKDCGRALVLRLQSAAISAEDQPPVLDQIIPFDRVKDMHPFRPEACFLETVGLAYGRSGIGIHRLAPVDNRPALFPCYRGQEGLAPEMVEIPAIAPVCKKNRPPGSVVFLEEIGVPCALHLVLVGGVGAVGEDGIALECLVWAVDLAAAGNGKLMRELRAPF